MVLTKNVKWWFLKYSRNRVGGDEAGPIDWRSLLDDRGRVVLDLGEVALELEAAASRKTEVDQHLVIHLNQGAAEGQNRASPILGLNSKLSSRNRS